MWSDDKFTPFEIDCNSRRNVLPKGYSCCKRYMYGSCKVWPCGREFCFPSLIIPVCNPITAYACIKPWTVVHGINLCWYIFDWTRVDILCLIELWLIEFILIYYDWLNSCTYSDISWCFYRFSASVFPIFDIMSPNCRLMTKKKRSKRPNVIWSKPSLIIKPWRVRGLESKSKEKVHLGVLLSSVKPFRLGAWLKSKLRLCLSIFVCENLVQNSGLGVLNLDVRVSHNTLAVMLFILGITYIYLFDYRYKRYLHIRNY